MILGWILTSTHKHHIKSIKYSSHKCLPEKSRLDCLKILIMSWLIKDPVVIMKKIMSWQFKNPILIVTWLNFDHAQSNSYKWPKKIKLSHMNFFLEKRLIKFSCTYKSLSFYKVLKNFLEPIQSYEDVPFVGPKSCICLEKFILVQNVIITFIYLFTFFSVQS